MYVPDVDLRGLDTGVDVTGFKRFEVPIPGQRAHTGRKAADTTETERTPVSREINLRFTVEDLAVLPLRTGVAVETGFQNKTERQIVAQIFGALKPETRTGVVAARHGKRIVAAFGVLIRKARIHNTIKRHFRCHCCTGKRAQNRNCGECLFHEVLIRGVVLRLRAPSQNEARKEDQEKQRM